MPVNNLRTINILCVSDFVDPLVYSVNAKERFKHIDLILSAGDLPMSYLEFIASTLNKELCFVFGNHNLKHLWQFKKRKISDPFDNAEFENTFAKCFGATYVSDRIKKCKGLLIAGLGGSIQYNNGENQFTELQMAIRIIKLIPQLLINKFVYKRYLDVLLTHSPPKDLNDREDRPHRGFTVFRYFIKLFRPRYCIHGHIHLLDLNEARQSSYCNTEIINVYSHYILKITQ